MTRRRVDLAMERIYSKAPKDKCEVQLVAAGPEDRGDLGRINKRAEGGGVRRTWSLRCPWCRELLYLELKRVHVKAGEVSIAGGLECDRCQTSFNVESGVATRDSNGRPQK